jgi:hypothetical protein
MCAEQVSFGVVACAAVGTTAATEIAAAAMTPETSGRDRSMT